VSAYPHNDKMHTAVPAQPTLVLDLSAVTSPTLPMRNKTLGASKKSSSGRRGQNRTGRTQMKVTILVVGAVVLLFGLHWIGQGTGFITWWAYYCAAVAAIGVFADLVLSPKIKLGHRR